MGLPYAMNNGNLEKFLNEIQSASVPTKLDVKYLNKRGYTGTNDRYLIAFMKNLGFIDGSGSPLPRWHQHRRTDQARTVRADAVRDAYQGLFNVYADAHRRSELEFTNWARVEEPSASPKTISRSWATFKTMVKLSDFTDAPSAAALVNGTATVTAENMDGRAAALPPSSPRVQLGVVGGITINIELQLPASADAKFFEQFFSSMRKHLIDQNE